MRQKLLFMQAPTGVGKTISTIFPAVKAVGEEPVSYTHLEEELGITVFMRNNRGITVTAEGEEFLGYAKH